MRFYNVDEFFLIFTPDFGQRVPPLVDYLCHVLERYPDGGQILKVSKNQAGQKLTRENLKVLWAEF